MKNISPVIFILALLFSSSCKKEDLFEQPGLEVLSASLMELPGAYVNLEIDVKVSNRDARDAKIKDVDYTVILEGATSEEMSFDILQTIPADSSLTLKLPLSIHSGAAIKLLSMLDAGESIKYQVIGTFHLDDPLISLIDLPINVYGETQLDIGFEDFYKKPDVELLSMSGSYNADTYYVFNFNVECLLTNNEDLSIKADEIEYIVTVEDIRSKQHFYSEAYTAAFSIDALGEQRLNLPISILLNNSNGEKLAEALNSNNVSYTVEALIHIIELNGTSADFTLPLYLSDVVKVDILSSLFVQPSIEITSYSLKSLPTDSAYLDITMMVTNNDNREVLIKDVEYIPVVEGVTASEEFVKLNEYLYVGEGLELTLPLTLEAQDAAKLLEKLDAGESLDYAVTGTFHVDEPVVDLFDLPIDITGTATVDVGYEDFYEQPDVVVNDIDVNYSISGFTHVFDMDVNCTVTNEDTRTVTVDKVVYTAIIEGFESDQHTYQDAAFEDIVLSGGESMSLELPVVLRLSISEGPVLLDKLTDGTAAYVVRGTFHATTVDGQAVDFTLPLYSEGEVPVTIISN